MLDNLPSRWSAQFLGDVFSFRGGGTPDKKKSAYWIGDIPWASVKDIKSKYLEKTIDHITEEGLNASAAHLATIGDLVLLTRIEPGKIAIVKRNVAVNQDCKIATPNGCVDIYWAYYLFKSLKQEFVKRSSGTTVLGIRLNDVNTIPIALPPLNEQKRIVTKIETLFSELDNGIAYLKTAREQLKVYRQAVLKHAFEGKLTEQWREGNANKLETQEQLLARIQQEREARHQLRLTEWKQTVKDWEASGKKKKKPKKPPTLKPTHLITVEEINRLPVLPKNWGYVRLSEIAAIGSGMSVSKDRKPSNPIEVPYLRVANVQRGLLVLTEIKTMTVEREALQTLLLRKWDVLFNEGGDRDKLGRGWVWENQIDPCITQNHVFHASPYVKSEYHSKFISHWGNSFGKNYFDKGGKQTTNLASINKTVLSDFPIPLPSFNEQREIILLLDDTMNQIDTMQSDIDTSIQQSESLRQSILKKAFSGQLVPQDPNDEPASELLARIQTDKAMQEAKTKVVKTKPTTRRGRKPTTAAHT